MVFVDLWQQHWMATSPSPLLGPVHVIANKIVSARLFANIPELQVPLRIIS